jgi:hypothetical protein
VNIQSAINAGLFVEFVYNNWTSATPRPNLNGMAVVTDQGNDVVPGKKYTVLKTIYSNDLATDISPLLPDFITMGIVAATPDLSDIVIAIRGTDNIWEWLQDVKFLPRTFPRVDGAGLTDDGFTDMYLSFSLSPASSTTFIADLQALIPSGACVTIVGHSLGSSLATLLALDLSANTKIPINLYTFASPRVGDLSFERLFDHIVPNAYRIANRLDIVPKTPPPLLYFHVGDETEVVPGPEVKFDLVAEHTMTTYFNMLAKLINPAQTQYPILPKFLRTP